MPNHSPSDEYSRRKVPNVLANSRDELLNREIFDTLLEAKVLIERWRVHYNTVRLHSSLGYRPPAPEAVLSSSHRKQITT
jgi:transposase InsO family protein